MPGLGRLVLGTATATANGSPGRAGIGDRSKKPAAAGAGRALGSNHSTC